MSKFVKLYVRELVKLRPVPNLVFLSENMLTVKLMYNAALHRKKLLQDTARKEQMIPVITTSPSEDHTYSAGPTIAAAQGIVHPALPSSSPDEAFEEGSESDDR